MPVKSLCNCTNEGHDKQPQFPKVLIIGMPKAGSKALRWMMGMHSKIVEVSIKGNQEVSFFNKYWYLG